jgi:phytoene desaturase
MDKANVIVIGAGFAGLSAACKLASLGYKVTVLEKNEMAGGRARKIVDQGFTFDMGPSWYWMPDVFEDFFSEYNKKVSDYYELVRLDPSYKIFFGQGNEVILPANIDEIYTLYEAIEPGSSKGLKKFLKEAQQKYSIGMGLMVHKPSHSVKEFMNWKVIKAGLKLNIFSSFANYTRSYFKNPIIQRMLEFPVLFLGGTAESTPALYSLMNYSDMVQGTWYPKGGMYKVIEAMVSLAEELGVQFKYKHEVLSIDFRNDRIRYVVTNTTKFHADFVIASADYEHVEQKLLPYQYRKYSPGYWKSRVLSPSSLIFFLGFKGRIPELNHHTLLFDEDFKGHAQSIYSKPGWPEKPSIYISCTSRTDQTVAPPDHENLMVLIPVAPGLDDTDSVREKYFDIVMTRIERYAGRELRDNLVYKRSYAHRDFLKDYNAYKGNAYGLANTLMQTAFLKPSMRNPKIKNLIYAGQLTVPGPGIPPAIISGRMAAIEIDKLANTNKL